MTKTVTVQYRRKREGKTNYHKRLRLLMSNKSRLVIRRSHKNTLAQIVEYHENGDKVLASVLSKSLKKCGWNHSTGNIPAAYLTGIMLGTLGKKKNQKSLTVDTGLATSVKGSSIYALIKGVNDAGVSVACDESMYPSDDRIMGKHLKKNVAEDVEKVKKFIFGESQ